MTQSETGLVAVPSSADSWTDIATITVPAGVKRLKKVRVGIAPDWGTTAGSVRHAPVYRLQGSGLLEQSPHEYIGPFGGHAEATTGGIAEEGTYLDYDVDIPVQTGGQIVAQVNTLDEAVTAGSTYVNLFFDEKDPVMGNSMSQYVDAAGTTTADAYATVGTFTVPRPAEGKAPTKIRKVVLAVAVDQGTSAISLRTASRFRLTGSGIGEGGNHDFVGPLGFSGMIGASASQGAAHSVMTAIIDVDIPVNAGGQILAEHRYDVETPTASTVAVGLLYE